MKSVRILQLGDVHYPDSKDASSVDYKDKTIAPSLILSLVPPSLQQVLRTVLEVSDSFTVSGVLICGDLTSRGNLTQYGPCVQYLIRGLGLGTEKWPQDNIHVVPGNHDVNQSECDPTGADLFKKFAPLKAEWDRQGLPILVPDDLRTTTIVNANCSVQVYSLNSCIGCRERRSLPQPIETEFKRILDAYHIAHSTTSFELLGEQLDTPAFHREHIENLLTSIRQLPIDCVPLVLTHHNVLPQATMRVDLYTEVINGGPIRSRMATADRRIVYCHGHIHNDPIEIVTNPKSPNGGLLSVSAPELKDGFNLLEFIFSGDNVPIGLAIIHYRTTSDGAVERREPIRVPLVKPSDATTLGSDSMTKALTSTTLSWERFPLILSRSRSNSGIHHPQSVISSGLVEAEWFSFVEILDRNKDCKHWTIRRIQP